MQRIAAEPETQFLITEAFRPHQATLEKMAGKVIGAIEKALGAMKTDKQDHTSRLKAVERYGEVMELAQGKVAEKSVDTGFPQYTWEEFSALYHSRKIAAGKPTHIESAGQPQTTAAPLNPGSLCATEPDGRSIAFPKPR